MGMVYVHINVTSMDNNIMAILVDCAKLSVVVIIIDLLIKHL